MGEAVSAGRLARFNVRARLDGQNEVTVELKVTAGEEDAVVSVRPKHSRRVYTAMLSEVALIVAARHVKALMAQAGLPVPGPRKVRR
jgi:hypothetical protein